MSYSDVVETIAYWGRVQWNEGGAVRPCGDLVS